MVQLKEFLRKKGNKTVGTKAVLVERARAIIEEEGLDIQAVFRQMEQSENNDEGIPLGGSASTSGSTRSSVSSMKAAALSKSAGLKAKMEKLRQLEKIEQEKQRIEQEKQRIEQQETRLKMEAELAAAEAEAKVFEDIENPVVSGLNLRNPVCSVRAKENLGNFAGQFDDAREKVKADLGVKKEPSKPIEDREIIIDDKDVIRSLVTSNIKGLMPHQELIKFAGEYVRYHEFIRTFDSLIASKLISASDKLQYLRQYTSGRPQEIVRSCLHLDPVEGYERARKALDKKYGNTQHLTSAYIERILNWPDINKDNIDAMEEYSIELGACMNAMSGVVGGIYMLESPKNMQAIVRKLPFFLQDRWRRIADSIENAGEHVSFGRFVEFLEVEVRIATNPVFGRKSIDKNKKGSSNQVKAADSVQVRSNVVKGTLSCWHCKGSHILDECTELKDKNREEIIRILRELKLCFACLRRNHRANECRNKKTCNECSGSHPTLLHFRVDNKTKDQDNNDSKVGVFTSLMPGTVGETTVVPVKVRMNGKEVFTKAYIDNGSNGSFCTKNFLKKFGRIREAFREQNINIVTMIGERNVKCFNVLGLSVTDVNGNNDIPLPPVYAVDKLPIERAYSIDEELLDKWEHLQAIPIDRSEAEVELLLGSNVPQASEPYEVINSRVTGDPYGVKTKLGWVIVGNLDRNYTKTHSNRVFVRNVGFLDRELINSFNKDFQDLAGNKKEFSREEQSWLKFVSEGCHLVDGKYEIPLPLKDGVDELPPSRDFAVKRLFGLKRKLQDENYLSQYSDFMDKLVNKGYAEEVPLSELNSLPNFYIPHFGVRHQEKPGTIRVVFDCAAKINDVSLNEFIRPGPDINNLLLGVLLRFRVGLFSYSADIETMFYQVKVPKNDKDLLRYVWWRNNVPGSDMVDMRMTSHPFGACSSPSIANFALKQIVSDFGDQYSSGTRDIVLDSFYVDDCLVSLDYLPELINSSKELVDLCCKGGFNLTKFCSPDIKFLKEIPIDKLHKRMLEYINGNVVNLKALGLIWELNSDKLGVSVKHFAVPGTKRQLLSAIASFFDPLGLLAPFVLEGRIILQDVCRIRIGWDENLDNSLMKRISNWYNRIKICSNLHIDRCFKPCVADDIVSIQWHIFSDASEAGYGSVVYLRLIDSVGKIFVNFVLGKAKVAPLKAVSIPRLELAASVLSVRLKMVLCNELDLDFRNVYFWTDSTTVLRYLRSNDIRYQTFVANRVAFVSENSNIDQWHYVNGSINPADDSSRAKQSERWCFGPEFLYSDCSQWPVEPVIPLNAFDDLEVKRVRFAQTKLVEVNFDLPFMKFINYFSSWVKLCRSAAWVFLYISFLVNKTVVDRTINVNILLKVELKIISYIQGCYFPKEMSVIAKGGVLPKSSSLLKLNPILIENVLRVGGRLDRFDFSFDERHPIIIPNKCHITDLIIRYYHVKVGHMGLQMVLSSLRARFWIVRGTVAVRRILSSCVECRRYKGNIIQQQMADLPIERAAMSRPPFFITGLDAFGPFYVKRGRSQVKRYGIVFTCLTIRAIHLEVAVDLSTDAFINALRRFLCRRGQVKKIKCDRGTNFIGASGVLDKSTIVDERVLSVELLNRGIEWEFNPPGASHFGGTWERMIASVRRILDVVVGLQVLSDDSLHTLFCEVEAIVNSRPLSSVSSDPRDVLPLTPNRLLSLSDSPLPLDSSSGNYSRNRWKQVQYLADQFWLRWKKEYFLCLNQRQKWFHKNRNVSVGDLVLLVDECKTRGHWAMARVMQVKISLDGLVRSVIVKKGSKTYERPISKLIMLLEDN